MARRAFEMMMEGVIDAIAYAEGDTTRGRVVRPMEVKGVRAMAEKSRADSRLRPVRAG